VWKDAYTALTGLYLGQYKPEIHAAFVTALNADATIGERIGHPADRSRQLAGDVWFYYGSRFAEYLDGEKDARAEDFLESEIEAAPSNSAAYADLADYSAETSRRDSALSDYRHSLDLDRDQPDVLDSMAKLEWDEGKHDDAIAAWTQAVKQLAAEMDARKVPETFWSDFGRVLDDISAHGQYDKVSQAVDAMLRIYVARNGDYRTEPLLEAGYKANGKQVDWLLTITAGAANQRGVLESILPNNWSRQGEWIKKGQLSRIRERIVELAERDAGANRDESNWTLENERWHYVDALIEEKKYAQASAVLAGVSEKQRNSSLWLGSVLELAATDGTLSAKLSAWKKQPAEAPSDQDLRNATRKLAAKDERAVMRFVYERALDRRELTAANFLGLAGIDLDENNTAAAVELLKRLVLVSTKMYADGDAAAKLLEDHKKPAEALEFLRPLAASSPWEAGYKVRIAKAMLAADAKPAEAMATLTAEAGDAKARYSDRVAAAEALKGHGAEASGSDELKLLAQAGCPAADAAAKPYFTEARIAAAACAASPKLKEHLLHDALSAVPGNGQLRLSYVFAAFAAGNDSRALVAADPLLQSAYYGGYSTSYDEDEDDTAPSDDQDATDTTVADQAQTLTLSSLAPKQAARLLELASAAYERRHDYENASHMLSAGQHLIDDAALRKGFQQKQVKLAAEMARAEENDARAPTIHKELDQDHVVRPRLLAGMAAPEKQKKSEDQ
jgi:hypothetical protein